MSEIEADDEVGGDDEVVGVDEVAGPSRRLLIGLGALTVVTVGAGLLAGTVPPCSTGNILDLEVARTSARATELIGSCGADGLDALRRGLRVDDVVFIPLYVVTISAWAFVAARRLRRTSALRRHLVQAAAPVVLLAGVFDLVENHHLRNVVAAAGASDATGAAFTASLVKWVLVAYALGATLVALARSTHRALRR